MNNSARLNRLGFRVLINLQATEADLDEALTNRRTSLIIWSSHGAPDGIIDALGVQVGKEVVRKMLLRKKPTSLILACCESNMARTFYFPDFESNEQTIEIGPHQVSTFLGKDLKVGSVSRYLRGDRLIGYLIRSTLPFKSRCDYILR